MSGSGQFMVTGGYLNDEQEPTARTEVLDLATLEWREAPALPSGRGYATSAQASPEEPFYIVGGTLAGSGLATDEVLEYEPLSGSWQVRPERLSTPRTKAAAVMVEGGIVPCT